MGTTERVAFRYYENQAPQWEAYGLDSAAYGSGDTLAEARADIKSAISLLHPNVPRVPPLLSVGRNWHSKAISQPQNDPKAVSQVTCH